MTRVVVVGSYIQDLVFSTETLPAPGETRIAQLTMGHGGKGSNQAVACRRQGVETLLVSAVGDDVFGRSFADFARREGLETALESRIDTPTGVASILVEASSQNLIAVALGAAGKLSEEHVEKQRARIEAASVLLVQLESNLNAVRLSLQIARKAGVTTILNPAPIHTGVTTELLALADILTPNETELAFLLGKLADVRLPRRYWEVPDEELACSCRRLGCPTVVLTLGAEGVFVAPLEGKPYRLPAIAVHPVDTTGAGDAFSGALAAGLVLFAGNLTLSLRHATVAAGLSTEKPGAAASMPTAAAVEQYLQR